jgi:hypothetical protein
MTDLEGIRAMVQDAINSGATTVEDIHKKIASMPLATFKNVEGVGSWAQSTEDMTHATIGTIYESIRQVNDQVGQISKQMLEASGAAGRGGTKEE